ncbi:MAG: 3'-5' exonuclease, partial [Pseudomonas sp.]
MSLFSWLRPVSPILPGELQQRLERLPAVAELGDCSLREQRWVVLDLETTGLNL